MSLIRIRHILPTRGWVLCLAWMALALVALAQSISTTTVQGTVYLANGTPGSGTLQISWPAFTTASNQTVAAGKITANIGANGFVSVNLAPNLGSSPAGLYYTAVYHMSDGTTSTEYWVIPAAAQAGIAQVRSQVMPAAQAVQAVSKAYVDQAIQSVAQGNLTSTGGQLTGPLYLTGDPTQPLQAADKHYVDASLAQALPLTGGAASGPLTATQLGAAYQVDQFSGADFGAKLQACLAAANSSFGGICDARNFSGNLSMAANLTISQANTTVMLPCATISTASQIIVTAGTRNISLRGCALRGSSNAGGGQGGTVLLYSGTGPAIQVGDNTYAADTLGFHLDNVAMNTTNSTAASAQAFAAYRTQELDLESLYLLGNGNQTGITLDGTGNYTGGTFYDNHISGFQIAINGVGHQVTNSAATDWLNASTFVRLHIDCPTTNGNPIPGTYGVNLLQGDGNTFTGGDVENCGTAMHLGANAQNNTIVGLRNENSNYQVIADPGSSYNSWMSGGTMFTGKLTDNGTRNSFLDSFHRSFNSLNGDWYGSQQDATLTNHYRLGIGTGSERGLLDRYQTDYGYRWTMGLSDATGGEQFYQVLDELNSVYRISVGQYNNGQSSTNNQTVLNAAGTGAVVLNGSNNAGTGGVVFGSGGPNASTVATINNAGNAQFNGTLQVAGTSQSAGTMTVRNNADAEVDYYLWPGLTSSQKGSYTYKDYNGNSQWYMVKDAGNNWALNSAVGGLDSFKAYQSTNSGDTYINASNASGVVRVNYEPGSGSAFNIYGGNSSNLYAGFSGASSIKFPGLSASSGHNCLQIDSSGYITNTGAACGAGSGSGTVNSGSAGQIAYYNGNGAAISGMSAVPISAGGTGATTAAAALAAIGGVSQTATAAQTMSGPLNASVNSQINVMDPRFGAKGDCTTDDTGAFSAAQAAAIATAVGNSLPAVLYLPKPPGGCYIVSNWTWQGVSLEGQPSGLGAASPQSYNVTLKSKPGTDILHIPDPTVTSGQVRVYPGWSINNVSFLVDNSVAGTFPHRWPGRWFDDGAITGGSATFTSTYANISCGDVGQAIVVGGAGGSVATNSLAAAITSATQKTLTLATGVDNTHWPITFGYLKIDSEIMMYVGTQTGGATTITVLRGQAGTTAATHSSGATVTVLGNLTTTISSVTPCWQSPTSRTWQTVTLAASASSTISNAHTYISVLGLPATENIGNCAIAADLQDGNSADWVGTSLTGNYGRMENTVFTTTSSTSNDVCGMYFQGFPLLYGLVANNFGFYGEKYGVVQGTTEINPFLQSSSGDYEQWNHGLFFFPFTPWISVNGLSQRWTDIQLTSFAGPQILSDTNNAYDVPGGWHVSNSGFETPYNATAYGWRVEGSGHTFDQVALTSGAAGQYGYFDANSSTCNCGGSNVYLNGYGNSYISGPGGVINNGGLNNSGFWNYSSNPFNGVPANYNVSMFPSKGTNNLAGRFTGDFAYDQNFSTPYSHDDLILWPTDFVFGSGTPWNSLLAQDSTSPSGYYFNMVPGANWYQWQQFILEGNTSHSLVVGTNLPATGMTIGFEAKCAPGTTTFQFSAGASGGSANTGTYNCSTTYQYYTLMVGFKASDTGKWLSMSAVGNTFEAAYFVIAPFKGNFNYYTPAPTNGEVVLNFTNWTWTGATAATDPAAPYSSVENTAPSSHITALNGQTIIAGQQFAAIPSRITYQVGAPSIFSTTLNGAVANAATSITLTNATTSVWPATGYLMIDQEVMSFSAMTAGQSTINVTRAQLGTAAQSHVNGAPLTLVGAGSMQVVCNGAAASVVDVYFAPTYNVFSADFPAQQCSGYPTSIAWLGGTVFGGTGQQYNVAQVKIESQASQLNVPSTTRVVPVSAQVAGITGARQYAYSTNMPLSGSGAGIVTGPNSGTTAGHLVTEVGTTGQVQDSGTALTSLAPLASPALTGTPTAPTQATGDNSTNIATDAFVQANLPLKATSGSIGGSALTAGQCASGTVSVTGATTSMAVAVSPAGGTSPGPGFFWHGYVSTAGTVTVQVCAVAAGTPAAATYNVRVLQ